MNFVSFVLMAIAACAIIAIMVLAKPYRAAEDEYRRRCVLAAGEPLVIRGELRCLRRDTIIDLRKTV